MVLISRVAVSSALLTRVQGTTPPGQSGTCLYKNTKIGVEDKKVVEKLTEYLKSIRNG